MVGRHRIRRSMRVCTTFSACSDSYSLSTWWRHHEKARGALRCWTDDSDNHCLISRERVVEALRDRGTTQTGIVRMG